MTDFTDKRRLVLIHRTSQKLKEQRTSATRIVFELKFSKEGELEKDEQDFFAEISEAIFDLEEGKDISVVVSLEKIDLINRNLAELECKDKLSPQERIHRIELRRVAKEWEYQRSLISEGTRILLCFSSSPLGLSELDIQKSIRGLGYRVLSGVSRSGGIGIAIHRLKYRNGATYIYLNADETERLMQNFSDINRAGEINILSLPGWNVCELPHDVLASKAIPAIVLETLRLRNFDGTIDLFEVLNLNDWFIGLK